MNSVPLPGVSPGSDTSLVPSGCGGFGTRCLGCSTPRTRRGQQGQPPGKGFLGILQRWSQWHQLRTGWTSPPRRWRILSLCDAGPWVSPSVCRSPCDTGSTVPTAGTPEAGAHPAPPAPPGPCGHSRTQRGRSSAPVPRGRSPRGCGTDSGLSPAPARGSCSSGGTSGRGVPGSASGAGAPAVR